MATNPTGGSGTPSTASAPSSTPGSRLKILQMQVQDEVHCFSNRRKNILFNKHCSPYDRQMTYYRTLKNTSLSLTHRLVVLVQALFLHNKATTSYTNWQVKWTSTVTAGYNGLGSYNGVPDGLTQMSDFYDGYLSISADDGPGMN